MTAGEIRSLATKTFSYLDKDDIRLNLSDTVIIKKEHDLVTDSLISETDIIGDFCI